MVAVIYSPRFLEHATGRLHPERPERLQAICAALQAAPWSDRLEWVEPTSTVERDVLGLVRATHAPDYVERVRQLAARGGGRLDPDTGVSARSYEVALLAVSAWCDGVDRALQGQTAFVLARPPGHHAEPQTGMGFCLFSNAGIAARYALEQPGIARAAILDWDVHHGNGTQAIAETDPRIAYCSLHQSPAYPGTGTSSETGRYGNICNLPLPPGSAIATYRQAFDERAIPFLRDFDPDLTIVSAGYDASRDDPLASMMLLPEDYAELTARVLEVSPRVLFGLEGGYDLEALARSVTATVARCLQERPSR